MIAIPTYSVVQLADLSLDELLELGICECGQRLEDHPPLEPALPWGHGRPCSADQRYQGQAAVAVARNAGWSRYRLPAGPK